ncbi:uncharacterized protein LOC119306240 [Triticum dicoccoides]|uniref:uncharacterized protein LOC119306240 n=1 Tax=Triticum dicoccoides TaxID=85692 RepID=UPI00188FAAE8|nr:uncharacterized protein LOC119306240 [Triticum dicoccoides]
MAAAAILSNSAKSSPLSSFYYHQNSTQSSKTLPDLSDHRQSRCCRRPRRSPPPEPVLSPLSRGHPAPLRRFLYAGMDAAVHGEPAGGLRLAGDGRSRRGRRRQRPCLCFGRATKRRKKTKALTSSMGPATPPLRGLFVEICLQIGPCTSSGSNFLSVNPNEVKPKPTSSFCRAHSVGHGFTMVCHRDLYALALIHPLRESTFSGDLFRKFLTLLPGAFFIPRQATIPTCMIVMQ